MQRVLEPEVMDSWEEAVEYDAMDFMEVNTAFAQRVIELGPPFSARVLDAGTGSARIPVLLCQMRHGKSFAESSAPMKPNLWQVFGIDLAKNMLQIGYKHVEQAGLQQQIVLELVDAKHLPYQDGHFEMVVSNSLVHHLPEPLPFFLEVSRVLKPSGAILIRDLIRPPDQETINGLVESIGAEYDTRQKQLFRDSLHAALTLDEVKCLIEQSGLQGVMVYQSSERHWTAERPWSQES